MKKYIILIIGIFLFTGCLKDDDLKLKSVEYIPAQLNDGWQTEPFNSENFNMDILNSLLSEIYSEDKFMMLRSFVVVHNGKIAVESYPRDLSDKETPHQLWSTTKSFISMLTGIAIDKGYINNVNDSVFKYIPEYLQHATPSIHSLTIEQCLTMRSGIDYDNDRIEEEMLLASVPDDLTRFIVELPVKNNPGVEAYYKNSDPQLLVKVVSNCTKTDLVEFADSNLFSPLGIDNYFWSRNKDKTPFAGFGLWMTPRDLAKIGLMLLDDGKYNGKQILSAEYIKEATTFKTEMYNRNYGYLFWIHPENKYFWTWGAGGQFIFVVPDEELVVVITSEQFGDNQYTDADESIYIVEEVIRGLKL